jgi:hypothetical protein
MKKIIAAAASVTAIAALAVPALASASVERYQTSDATFTLTQPAGQVSQWDNLWTHQISVHVNPCDNTFTGDGVETGPGPTLNEKINGSFGNGTVSLTAKRTDGVSFSLANAPTDSTNGKDGTLTLATSSPVVPWDLQFHVTTPQFTSTSNYKNHGDYVSSQGGGADAAHSCIGMPIQSSK